MNRIFSILIFHAMFEKHSPRICHLLCGTNFAFKGNMKESKMKRSVDTKECAESIFLQLKLSSNQMSRFAKTNCWLAGRWTGTDLLLPVWSLYLSSSPAQIYFGQSVCLKCHAYINGFLYFDCHMITQRFIAVSLVLYTVI